MLYFVFFCIIFLILAIILLFWCLDEYDRGITIYSSPFPIVILSLVLVLWIAGISLFCLPYEKVKTEEITVHNVEGSSVVLLKNSVINLNRISGLNFENEEKLQLKTSGPEWHGFIYLDKKYEILKDGEVICSKFSEQLP